MVTDFWSAVEPMLAQALEHHPHLDADGVLRLLLAQFGQLFVMTENDGIIAACVMERVQYPSHVVANVIALAGRHGVYRKNMDVITAHLEAWARARGCDRIAFVGRPGWTKFATRKGGQTLPLMHAWKSLEG
jgi:hypothetical protein